MIDLHLIVANPYTLLTTIKEGDEWFTVLDLKDGFFCIPLETENQPLLSNGKVLQLAIRLSYFADLH